MMSASAMQGGHKKNVNFRPGGVWFPNTTIFGMVIEEVHTILVPQNGFTSDAVFAAMGAENFGEMYRNFKFPHNCGTPWANPWNLMVNPWKNCWTNPDHFVKIAQRICPFEAFIFQNYKKFQFWAHAPALHRSGWNLAWINRCLDLRKDLCFRWGLQA